MNVRLFIPCSIDLFYPSIGIKTVEILEKLGCNVIYNQDQTCCGKWIDHFGLNEFSKDIKQKYIHDHFSSDYLVSPDNSCLQHIFEELDNHDWSPLVQSRVNHIKSRMYELSDFLVNVLEHVPDTSNIIGKVAINDNLNHILKRRTSEALVKIFNANPSSKIDAFHISDTHFNYVNTIQSLFWPKITQRILGNFQENLQSDYDAQYFIDADIVSVNYFRKYIAQNNLDLKVLHPTDLFG